MLIQKSKLKGWFLLVFVAIAFLGFVDAGYLSVSELLGHSPACGPSGDCNVVTTSSYSKIGPIPVAILGAIYYLAIIIFTVYYLDKGSERVLRRTFKLTWVGLLASLYFVFLQLFVLKAICRYCMGSALTSTLLFILAMLALRKLSLDKREPDFSQEHTRN